MQVTETHSEGLKRGYKVVVPASQIEERMTARLAQLSKEVQMPGFRPGKVPAHLIRKLHGKSVMGEVLEQLVNDSTTQALGDNDIQPALQPKIEITQFEEGSDLEYTVDVEIMPTIEPVDFATIKLERLTVEVSDDVVDERVGLIAGQMKNYVETEDGTAAEDGDTVEIDFLGTVDGEAFDGGAADDFALVLGSNQFIPGFEEQLVGAKAGDQRDVEVTFPDDYQSEKLAGKAAVFAVTVKKIKRTAEEAIDDEFAKKLGMEGLSELKDMIRQQIEKEYSDFSRERIKRSLLDELAESHTYEVPQGMVDMEFEQIWHSLTHDMEERSQTFEDLDKSEEETKEEYRSIAQRRVRLGLLLSEVGRVNNLQVGQDEVSRAISEQSRRYPGQEQQIHQYYQENQDAQSQIRAPLLEEKVVDFILEMAQIEERAVSLEELMRDPDADETDATETAAPEKKKAAAKKKTSAKKKSSDEKKAAADKSDTAQED